MKRARGALPTLAVVEAALALAGCGRRPAETTTASADRVATVPSGLTDAGASTSARTGATARASESASCDGRAAPSGSLLPRAMTVAGPGQGMMVLPVRAEVLPGAAPGVDAVVAKNKWRARACQTQASQRDEKPESTVRVAVTVDATGKATKAVATGATSKETATCLEDALRAPTYPLTEEGKPHAVTAVLTFGGKP